MHNIVVAEFFDGFTLALPAKTWPEYLMREALRVGRAGRVRISTFEQNCFGIISRGQVHHVQV